MTYQTHYTHDGPETAGSLRLRDRIIRGMIAVAAMVAVLAGVVSAPILMFALAIFSIYLVKTALIGVDPVYAVADRLLASAMAGAGKPARGQTQGV